jgi:mono/diheme cytochrome c family protein
MRRAIIIAGGFLLAAAILAAQTPSTQEGVYSEAQALRGLALYGQHCASCHGHDLHGHDDAEVPPLVDEPFAAQWGDGPLSALYRKVSVTMPARDPGSLQPQEAADIVAYLLQANRAPAGRAELPPDIAALERILIPAPATPR